MIANGHITKIICVIMAAAVLSCLLAVGFSERLVEGAGGTGIEMAYEEGLFDESSILRIDIRMEEGAWEEMLANALAEEYYACDVEINGQKLANVGIRPKGNTSLSSIASDPETDRFSLKLEFDHYVEGQTFLGLDKLVLNNNYADATNMKEAIVYDMYQYLGADASLYNYAEISVNGEYWGVYLALEAVEESFLLRNYGAEDGELYKPESMDGGGGHGAGNRDFADESSAEWRGGNLPEGEAGAFPEKGMPDGESRPLDEAEGSMPQPPEEAPNDMPDKMQDSPVWDDSHFQPSAPDRMDGMGNGFSMSAGGADLNYTDDDLDSYSVIWDGEVTDSGKNDHKRVIRALKNISSGTELEKYLDIDNVLRYMAVHTFSVNLDSLSGNMAHNYYLYEYNGKLNILPWDYNLSFGGMNMGAGGSTSGIINDAIDTPFQGTDFFDVLLEEEAYLEKYHGYLRQLVEEYVFGGKFEEAYSRIRSQIDELVATDPTAFYSYEEYEAGAEMLYQTVMLRAESVQGQLEGGIPSTDEGQRADASSLVDASGIDIEAMGTFGMGGGGFLGQEKSGAFGGKPFGRESLEASDGKAVFQGGLPSPEQPGRPEGNSAPPGEPGLTSAGGAVLQNIFTYVVWLGLAMAALLAVGRYRRH